MSEKGDAGHVAGAGNKSLFTLMRVGNGGRNWEEKRWEESCLCILQHSNLIEQMWDDERGRRSTGSRKGENTARGQAPTSTLTRWVGWGPCMLIEPSTEIGGVVCRIFGEAAGARDFFFDPGLHGVGCRG